MQEIVPYIIYCEETPNPASLKFVANRQLLVSGASADYENAAETEGAPVAAKLFQFPFVRRVFIASNYIAISKQDFVEWEEIRDELRTFLTDYLNRGNPIVEKLPSREVPKDSGFKEKISVNTQHAAPASETENKIIEVLEQYIRPAVEQDGGMITFKEFNAGIVTVQLRGSCSGCPSSTVTLKAGIEALLKRLLPDEVKEVVSEEA
jgi:Fe-S cluster biogenesis protein NfuA